MDRQPNHGSARELLSLSSVFCDQALDLVEEGGSKLTSAQTLAVDTQGNFRRVGMRISFASDLTLLTSVLLGVETARPVLSIGNLDLRGSDNEALTVVMDVYGFRSQ